MEYLVKGVTRQGDKVKKIFEAKDEFEAIKQAKQDGIYVEKTKKMSSSFLLFRKDSKIKLKDLIVLMMNLSSLLNAGIKLIDAISLMIDTSSGKLKNVLTEVRNDIQRGEMLSTCLSKHKYFPELVISLASLGENTGEYGIWFEIAAEYYDRKLKLKKKIKSATAYPSMVLIVGFLVTILISNFALPQLVGTLESSGVEINGYTKALLSISAFLKAYWIYVTLLILSSVMFFSRVIYPKNKRFFHKSFFKIPGIKKMYKKIITVEFARTYLNLDNAGVLLISSLDLIAKNTTNIFVKEHILECQEGVIKGEPFSESLSEHIFDKTILTMLKVKEEGGAATGNLQKSIELLDREVEDALSKLVGMINPIAIGILGIVIGSLIISIMMPMMQMYNQF
jgi:type IV pilus assembly protein PilC